VKVPQDRLVSLLLYYRLVKDPPRDPKVQLGDAMECPIWKTSIPVIFVTAWPLRKQARSDCQRGDTIASMSANS